MTRKWLWVCAAAIGLALLALPALGVSRGQVLLFLLVLLCPLMHLLGGHGHGHGGHGSEDARGGGAEAPGEQRASAPDQSRGGSSRTA